MTEDEMVRLHHRLSGRELGLTRGVGDGQGGLACSSPWGHKELDMTERLNWTEALYTTRVARQRCLGFGPIYASSLQNSFRWNNFLISNESERWPKFTKHDYHSDKSGYLLSTCHTVDPSYMLSLSSSQTVYQQLLLLILYLHFRVEKMWAQRGKR